MSPLLKTLTIFWTPVKFQIWWCQKTEKKLQLELDQCAFNKRFWIQLITLQLFSFLELENSSIFASVCHLLEIHWELGADSSHRWLIVVHLIGSQDGQKRHFYSCLKSFWRNCQMSSRISKKAYLKCAWKFILVLKKSPLCSGILWEEESTRLLNLIWIWYPYICKYWSRRGQSSTTINLDWPMVFQSLPKQTKKLLSWISNLQKWDPYWLQRTKNWKLHSLK